MKQALVSRNLRSPGLLIRGLQLMCSRTAMGMRVLLLCGCASAQEDPAWGSAVTGDTSSSTTMVDHNELDTEGIDSTATTASEDGSSTGSEHPGEVQFVAACGDGETEAAEACDDGNTAAGDGCSPTCAWEVVQIASHAFAQHTCARTADGRIKCWGDNGNGALGLEDTEDRGDAADEMGHALPYVDLGRGAAAVDVAVAYRRTCALLDDGTIRCWGRNGQGQLGLGDTDARGDEADEMGERLPSVDLGTGALDVAAGEMHTCALLDNGSVACWGHGDFLGIGGSGPLGDEPNEMGEALPAVDLGGDAIIDVAAGEYHTCARLEDGKLACWGHNGQGQLGLGDTNTRGDAPGEMGAALAAVDLGSHATLDVALGTSHTCALQANGRIKCWGTNISGQLGAGDVRSRGDEPEEMGDALPFVDLGAGVRAVALAAGSGHTCALLESGDVKCWGRNDFGQLGLGDTQTRGDRPGEMGDALPAVDLGTGRTARQITVGHAHTCALLDDGSVKCWGCSGNGRLGLGDEGNRGDEFAEMGDALPTVTLTL